MTSKSITGFSLSYRRGTVLGPLALLTFLLFLGHLCLVLLQLQPLLFSNNAAFFQEALRSGPVLSSLVFGFVALLICYSVYCLLIWFISWRVGNLFGLGFSLLRWIAVFIWLVFTALIFITNQIFFPYSQFSLQDTQLNSMPWQLFSPLFGNDQALHAVSLGLIGLAGLILLLASIQILRQWIAHWKLLLVCIAIGVAAFFGYKTWVLPSQRSMAIDPNTPTKAAPNRAPNIILIGINGVSPADLAFFGNINNQSPTLNAWLNDAVVFPNTFTPIPRVFPAWISVLTGNLPEKTGIPFNLTNPKNLVDKNTLGHWLQNHGYSTHYFSDNSRLNKISTSMGFHRVSSPPLNFSNFILSLVNDAPLTNWLINSRIGYWLLPASYANRASHVNYMPSTFSQRINNGLQHINKPALIAVNFTLADWPYTWNVISLSDPALQRQAALSAIDSQFEHLMKKLQKKHLLDNAIIVVFSPYGPSTAANNGLISTPQGIPYAQFNTLFAIQRTNKPFPSGQRQQAVSLINITPTLMALIGKSNVHSDGISLVSVLDNPQAAFTQRIMIASGQPLTALRKLTHGMSLPQALSPQKYWISCSTGQILLKSKAIENQVANQQRGIINWPMMTVQLPDGTTQQYDLRQLNQ